MRRMGRLAVEKERAAGMKWLRQVKWGQKALVALLILVSWTIQLSVYWAHVGQEVARLEERETRDRGMLGRFNTPAVQLAIEKARQEIRQNCGGSVASNRDGWQCGSDDVAGQYPPEFYKQPTETAPYQSDGSKAGLFQRIAVSRNAAKNGEVRGKPSPTAATPEYP